MPLPAWLNRPLEFLIMEWVNEPWDKSIHERNGKPLTCAQQSKYDAWRAKPERNLLVDLGRQCQATKPSKQVRVVTLRMSMQPEELGVWCGGNYRAIFVRHSTYSANALQRTHASCRTHCKLWTRAVAQSSGRRCGRRTRHGERGAAGAAWLHGDEGTFYAQQHRLQVPAAPASGEAVKFQAWYPPNKGDTFESHSSISDNALQECLVWAFARHTIWLKSCTH